MRRDSFLLSLQERLVGVSGTIGVDGPPGPRPTSIDTLVKSGGDQAIAAGSWVAVTELAHTVTVAAGNRLFLFAAIMVNHGTTSTGVSAYQVDSGAIVIADFRGTNFADTLPIATWITGLSAGAHTITNYIRNDAGAFTVFGGTSSALGVSMASYSQLAVFSS